MSGGEGGVVGCWRYVVVFIVCQVLSVFDRRQEAGDCDTCDWPLVV